MKNIIIILLFLFSFEFAYSNDSLRIVELENQVQILQKQVERNSIIGECYSDNINTIALVVTSMVVILTFIVGYIVPRNYDKRFDDKINNLNDKIQNLISNQEEEFKDQFKDFEERFKILSHYIRYKFLYQSSGSYKYHGIITSFIEDLQPYSLIFFLRAWMFEELAIKEHVTFKNNNAKLFETFPIDSFPENDRYEYFDMIVSAVKTIKKNKDVHKHLPGILRIIEQEDLIELISEEQKAKLERIFNELEELSHEPKS